MSLSKNILGIDPGSISTGYGLLSVQNNQAKFVECGVIQPKTDNIADKLAIIFSSVQEIIQQFKPVELAIEKVFISRNPDSALKLGQARGAAIIAAGVKQIAVFEYSANEIKKAVVGRGHASKEQVQTMITMLLALKQQPPSDAADALACALCHINNQKFI